MSEICPQIDEKAVVQAHKLLWTETWSYFHGLCLYKAPKLWVVIHPEQSMHEAMESAGVMGFSPSSTI